MRSLLLAQYVLKLIWNSVLETGISEGIFVSSIAHDFSYLYYFNTFYCYLWVACICKQTVCCHMKHLAKCHSSGRHSTPHQNCCLVPVNHFGSQRGCHQSNCKLAMQGIPISKIMAKPFHTREVRKIKRNTNYLWWLGPYFNDQF